MAFGKKNQKMVLFLTPSQMVFFGSNIKNMAVLPLKPDALRDLEIVDKDVLGTQITSFIQTNKIQPANIVILLSSAYIFSKNFPPVSAQYTADQLKSDIDLFQNYVPFQNPLIKTITTPKGTTVLVANGDIFIDFKQIFEPLNFSVDAIAPLAMIDSSVGDNFSPKIGQTALSKPDLLKQNGFSTQEYLHADVPEETELTEEEEAKAKTNKSTFLLIGVFTLLLVVLGVMLYMQQLSNNKPATPNISVTPTNAVVPTVPVSLTPTVTASTASATLTASDKSILIQILNGSGIPGQADQLKNELQNEGFTNIQTGNAPNVRLPKTLIVFSKKVSPTAREFISKKVEENFGDVSTQESETIQSDVVVTTTTINTPTPLP